MRLTAGAGVCDLDLCFLPALISGLTLLDEIGCTYVRAAPDWARFLTNGVTMKLNLIASIGSCFTGH